MRSNVCSANKAAAAVGDSHDMDGDHDHDDGDNDIAKMKNVHQFTKINKYDVESTVRTDPTRK